MTNQSHRQVVHLGTGIREAHKIYHYLCNKCGKTFISYTKGNYAHACWN